MKSVGRYEILGKIGHGGMGTVFKAFDPVLQRIVAVKVISGQLDNNPEVRERFFREARSAGQLSHKNIVVVYDLGEQDQQPYLAMEFLEGENIESRVRRAGRMRFGRVLRLASEICEGLEHAHIHGVLHRDIKPANLFLTDSGSVKILDFGLARLVSSELTHTQSVVGTANYMSPEQVRGERIDQRADIFSIGVVLYELLSGRRAFSGDSFATIIFKILQEAPEPLHSFDDTIPPPLVEIVDRALAKSRDERYPSVGELLRDLVICQQSLGSDLTWDDRQGGIPTSPLPTRAPTPWRSQTPAAATPAPDVGRPESSAGSQQQLGINAFPMRPVVGTLITAALIVGAGVWLSRRPPDAPPLESRQPVITERQDTPSQPVRQPEPPAPNVAREPEPPVADTGRTAPKPGVPAEGPSRSVSPPPAAHGRAQDAERLRADEALSKMATAKAAISTENPGGPLARQTLLEALAQERDGRQRYRAADYANAAAHFYQAAALFRNAAIAARADTAAQVEQQRKQEEEQRDRERLDQQIREQAEAARVPATPAPTAPPPPPAAAPRQEAAVQAVLATYVDALKRRNLDALKRIWPGLGGSQEQALRTELGRARSLQVQLLDPAIEIAGDSATVTAVRRYELVTEDGQKLSSETHTTISLRKAGETWVIQGIVHRRR